MAGILDQVHATSRYDSSHSEANIRTIEMHTAGEPLRVVVAGYPEIIGNTILHKRRFAKEHLDHLRRATIFEPRGHKDMYGVLLVEPERADSDLGVLFIHNEGYSTMCGHATIALARLVADMGWKKPKQPQTEIAIDAPCGLIKAYAKLDETLRVTTSGFENVPSFVVGTDHKVHVRGIGDVTYDLAYGGAFYALVNADSLDLACTPENSLQLIEKGMLIKHAVQEMEDVRHPIEPDLGFLYGTIFTSAKTSGQADSRNVCIFADGELDRSPTGSGVSARMALMRHKGTLSAREWLTIESIIGTTFRVCYTEVVQYGQYEAVIPVVEGSSFITGQNEILIDPDDPLKYGFILK